MLRTEFIHLPRISYKGIILSRAEWNFPEKEIKKFRAKTKKTLEEWRTKYKLPNLVVLADGDNELLINFKDPLSINILLAESKKTGFIRLKEFLFSTENPLVKDKKGAPYTNEFIACLLYTSPSPRDRTRSRMPSSA